jgi:hypothetical protein
VQLFSTVPMDALFEFCPLFQKGNVVRLGSQGCGKTMLLSLLRAEIRKAYDESDESSLLLLLRRPRRSDQCLRVGEGRGRGLVHEYRAAASVESDRSR